MRPGTLEHVPRVLQRRCVLAAGLCVAACTRVSDDQRFEPNPDTIEIAATLPQANAEAPTDVTVRLCWSDLLDPASLTDVDAVVGSGSLVTDAALRFELRPWSTALGEVPEEDAEPWCEGSVVTISPKEPLTAGVRYRIRLADEARGWNGQQPDVETPGWVTGQNGRNTNYFLEFDVVEGAAQPEESSEPLTLEDLFAPGALFDPQRAACSCHLEEDDDANTLLDLRDADAAYEDLTFDSRLRDTGYPMVTPRRPSESFLLHKVLRDRGEPLAGVLGDAMPPGETLAYADYVMLARWIEDGAMR